MPDPAWETMPELAASQSSAGDKSNASSLLASPNLVTPKPRAAVAAGPVPPEPAEVDSLCARAWTGKKIDEQQIADAVHAVDTQLRRSKGRESTACVMCGKDNVPCDRPMPFCGHAMLCSACGPKLCAKAERKGNPCAPKSHGEAYSRAMCRFWPCQPRPTPQP